MPSLPSSAWCARARTASSAASMRWPLPAAAWPRRGAGHRRLPACRAARPVRDVLERALPGCGGVLDAGASLKTVDERSTIARFCAAGYEPTLDEMVEVTFTVSAARAPDRGAHDPTSCRSHEYHPPALLGLRRRPARRLPASAWTRSCSMPSSCRPARRRMLSLQLPAEFVILFDPVTHTAQFIDVKGEPTRERQTLSIVFNNVQHADRDDRAAARAAAPHAREPHRRARRCPASGSPATTLHDTARPAPAVPHGQAAADQPDLPRPLPHRHARRRPAPQDHQPHLPVHRPQGLDRALRAGRRPRRLRSGARRISASLHEIVAAEAGAVVKTIGDAVMATFPTPDRARRRRAAHARGDAPS